VRARARPIVDGILHAENGQYVGSVETANIYMDDDGYVRVRGNDDKVGSEEVVEIYLDDEGHESGGEDD
jgi:hypothetical protein